MAELGFGDRRGNYGISADLIDRAPHFGELATGAVPDGVSKKL
jgi:hypothetical protein